MNRVGMGILQMVLILETALNPSLNPPNKLNQPHFKSIIQPIASFQLNQLNPTQSTIHKINNSLNQ